MAEAVIRPASTVILLRDGAEGLETLLLRRNRALVFAGGYWVFPGGAVDAPDLERAGHDVDLAARLAGAREAQEEAGVAVDPRRMLPFSHWTTPPEERKRFATWFFIAPASAPQAAVNIDGSEIHDARWLTVTAALTAHRGGELNLLPPTFISLLALATHRCVADAMAAVAATDPPQVTPQLARDGERMLTLYPGDADYTGVPASSARARHRAALEQGHWVYYYDHVSAGAPPLVPQWGARRSAGSARHGDAVKEENHEHPPGQ